MIMHQRHPPSALPLDYLDPHHFPKRILAKDPALVVAHNIRIGAFRPVLLFRLRVPSLDIDCGAVRPIRQMSTVIILLRPVV